MYVLGASRQNKTKKSKEEVSKTENEMNMKLKLW